MPGTYDLRLVALSVVLAMVSSYAALDLAARLVSTQGRARQAWLSCGAVAMGLGIWAMHYVGMLALTMPMPVSIICQRSCFRCWLRLAPPQLLCS